METLAADIAWHQHQIDLARQELAQARRESRGLGANIEIETLEAVLARLERTLAHLEELRGRRH